MGTADRNAFPSSLFDFRRFVYLVASGIDVARFPSDKSAHGVVVALFESTVHYEGNDLVNVSFIMLYTVVLITHRI